MPPNGYAVLEALLKVTGAQQKTRDKYAHWYWGTCEELLDGLVLVDPRHLMQRRARLLDATDFAELAKLVFSFANYVAEKDRHKRAEKLQALSRDARLRSILAPNSPRRKKPQAPE